MSKSAVSWSKHERRHPLSEVGSLAISSNSGGMTLAQMLQVSLSYLSALDSPARCESPFQPISAAKSRIAFCFLELTALSRASFPGFDSLSSVDSAHQRDSLTFELSDSRLLARAELTKPISSCPAAVLIPRIACQHDPRCQYSDGASPCHAD